MKVEDFVAITKDLCGFPSFFNAPFFRRVISQDGPKDAAPDAADEASQRITKDMFQSYWTRELAPFDGIERFFRVVKQQQNKHIERDDFAPFLHGTHFSMLWHEHGSWGSYESARFLL